MSGLLVIMSSPSGGGKTTIIQKILAQYPEKFTYSISATTRKMRPGEKDGIDYYFLSAQEFQEAIENSRFLEWEEVHGYLYGTPLAPIEKLAASGKHVFLDIDVNGALQVKKKYPGQAITIFIAPPSTEELVRRLKNRKTESQGEINRRLTRLPMEMEKSALFDFTIVNENADHSAHEVLSILRRYDPNLVATESGTSVAPVRK